MPIVVSLEASNTSENSWVEIRVADLGPGISDKEKDKIFQNYYSLKGGKTNGLGLAIVRSIAQAHGGTVLARDNTPHGAVLVIRFEGNKAKLY